MPKSLDGRRRKLTWRLILAATVFLAVALWVSSDVWTGPAGLIWHVFHGNFVSLDGQKIRVPWDMWVLRSDDQNLTILRQPPKYSILHSPSGLMLIGRTRVTRSVLPQKSTAGFEC